MQSSPPTRPRPWFDWRRQWLALAGLALLGTLPFWWTDLDTRAAALFYHPGAEDPWGDSGHTLWVFFYQASPLLAGLLMIGALLVVGAGRIWPRVRPLRPAALLLIGAVLVGPGLLINGLFKEHWGRPRPHETLALGGTQVYVPPLARTPDGGGKSFPCGHSSVGFALGAFFLIWQRRRPRLALAALLGSVALGVLMGIGRMSAGDHFLSDVIWSAVMTWGAALLLYYAILRIPAREQAQAGQPLPPARPLRHPRLTLGAYGLTAALMLLAVLLLTPVTENRDLEIQALPAGDGPRTLRLEADAGDLILFQGAPDWPAALIRFKGRGFGLPGSRAQGLPIRDPGTLTFRVTHRGVFTERDSTLTVGIDPSAWERVEMRTREGGIRVLAFGTPLPELILNAPQGGVLNENRPPAAPQ